MKSRVCFNPLAVPFHHGRRFHSFSSAVNRLDITRACRPRRLLLGVSILLILGWTIGAIWLINVRRGERSTAEALAQQRTIAAFYSMEMVRSR
jgi:hypothetical protein